MRIVRIYQSGDYQVGERLSLNPEASHHVAVVLRMRIKDPLMVFRGDNLEFTGCIHAIEKKQVVILLEAVKTVNRESPLQVHLAQAISKGDKMDWIVQKAVELGVTSITPIISERCNVKLDEVRVEKKLHLWRSIAIGACEQSGRNWLPKINPPSLLAHYVQEALTPLKWVLSPSGDKCHYKVQGGDEGISLLIGPEGGLTPNELTLAKNQGFQTVSLGPRILRTETAAIAILSILQALGGDL